MKASLQEIANRAGVSVKTVSGALNGSNARMADETRRKIQAIAEDLGYVVNEAARGLRVGYLPILAIVADELITTPFATEILRGLDIEASKSGLRTFAINRNDDQPIEDLIGEVTQFRPKAVAYAAMYHKQVEIPAALRGAIRLMVNCSDSAGVLPAIVPDNEQAATEITQRLIASGRRRIAFLNLSGVFASRLREKGFRAVTEQAGIGPKNSWVHTVRQGGLHHATPASEVGELVRDLMGQANPPDAILAGNDRIAMEVYFALYRLGRRIPEDVAVGSFDNNIDIAARLDPPLTTMALPHRTIGEMAGRMMVSGDDLPLMTQVPFQYVERRSL